MPPFSSPLVHAAHLTLVPRANPPSSSRLTHGRELPPQAGSSFEVSLASGATEAKRPGRTIAPPQRGVELLIGRLRKLLVMSPRETIRPKRALTSTCMEVPLNVAFCDAFLSPWFSRLLFTCTGSYRVATILSSKFHSVMFGPG